MLSARGLSIPALIVMSWTAARAEAGFINVANAGFEDNPLPMGEFAIQLHHTGWSATTNIFIVSGIAHPPLTSSQGSAVSSIVAAPD